MRISIVGLGKLGSPLAAVLASKGHTVVGVDSDGGRVRELAAGRAPVEEPGLAERIAGCAARLSATTDVGRAVLDTEATFIIVPTPSQSDGTFSSRHVLSCAAQIGAALARKAGYHLVVLTSTVMPGTTQNEFVPVLEEKSGKQCGPDFGVCYNPEFIAIGDVIRGMLQPDLVLIGESDVRAGAMLESLYRTVCENAPPVARLTFVNAEIAKIAVNTYVTMKISFANTLGEICERVPGGNADAVTRTVGLDSRIGRKYLTPALGYGGPCFPRDTVAFAALARDVGVVPALAEAADAVNRRQVPRLAARVADLVEPGGRVAVLGLSYRPGTGIVEASQGLEVAAALANAGYDVSVYDPAAMPAARGVLPAWVRFADSAAACVADAAVVVVATPWEEFRRVAAPAPGTESRRVVLDCWGIVEPAAAAQGTRLLRLGRDASTEEGPTA